MRREMEEMEAEHSCLEEGKNFPEVSTELEPNYKEARKSFPKDLYEKGMKCPVRQGVSFPWIVWEGFKTLDRGGQPFSCKGPDTKCL